MDIKFFQTGLYQNLKKKGEGSINYLSVNFTSVRPVELQ